MNGRTYKMRSTKAGRCQEGRRKYYGVCVYRRFPNIKALSQCQALWKQHFRKATGLPFVAESITESQKKNLNSNILILVGVL